MSCRGGIHGGICSPRQSASELRVNSENPRPFSLSKRRSPKIVSFIESSFTMKGMRAKIISARNSQLAASAENCARELRYSPSRVTMSLSGRLPAKIAVHIAALRTLGADLLLIVAATAILMSEWLMLSKVISAFPVLVLL